MPAPIGSKPLVPLTLEKSSDSLRESAKKLEAKSTGDKRVDAFNQTSAQAMYGTADAITARGATEVPTTGVSGWSSADVKEGGRYVAKGAARGLSSIAAAMGKLAGDGPTATVRELQADPNGVRFSERVVGKGAQQLSGSTERMNLAWGSYVEALGNFADSGANVTAAANHLSAVSGSLAKAAALTISAGATKMAEFGVRLSNTAVQAAETGTAGARDLLLLGAKFAAATAGILANADQPNVQSTVRGQLSAFQAQLSQLTGENPALKAQLQPLLAT